MSAIYFILSGLLSFQAHSATMEVAASPEDRIFVRGLDAQVHFIAQSTPQWKVSGIEESAEGQFVMMKKQGVLEIRMVEPGGKKNWLASLTRGGAPKKIEIVGPAVPVEVQLRGGSVIMQKWGKAAKVSMTSGRFSAIGGAGEYNIHVQKGDISIQDHQGRVVTDMYAGSTTLLNIQGDAQATVFTGNLNIEKMRGNLNLFTQQANSKINASTGSLQFDNGKGALAVTSFEGRLEGQNLDGSINVHMALDSELDVRSKAGRVAVQTPANSGMSLNLLTNEGEIVVPAPLRVTRLSAERSVRGKMRGDAQRGSVFVRSQEGTISVK